MPSVAVKLYSVFFKLLLKHRLQTRIQNPFENGSPFGVTSRPDEESVAPANPTFSDGVATKDIHIDPFTSLSVRIFLPDSSLELHDPKPSSRARDDAARRNSYGSAAPAKTLPDPSHRRNSYAGGGGGAPAATESANSKQDPAIYRGYSPDLDARRRQSSRKLPVILQFHGGGFVSGSNESAANDFFCRRIAKVCEVIVIAVGYRLAPENRYPAAFEDGLKVLNWLGKQANLAECSKSMGSARGGGGGGHIADTFGASMVEPWLAAHGDPSRYVDCTF